MKHTTAMRKKPAREPEKSLQPYIKKVTEQENLPVDQKSLEIMDVFKGQVTPMVLNLYKESNIVFVLVPANMTNFLQPLDLTIVIRKGKIVWKDWP